MTIAQLPTLGGKHPVYLVTSVLDEGLLSDIQVIKIY